MVLNRSESGMGAVPPGLRWEAALGCALRRLAVIFTKGVEAPTLAQHWVGSQELGARRLEPRSPGAHLPGRDGSRRVVGLEGQVQVRTASLSPL